MFLKVYCLCRDSMLFPYFSDISGRNNWTWFFHVHLSQCFGSPSKLLGKKNLQRIRDHFNSAMENRFFFNITESASVSEKNPNKQPMITGILPGFSLFTPSWLWGQSNPHSFFFFPRFSWCAIVRFDIFCYQFKYWSQFVPNCDFSIHSGLWWPTHALADISDLHLYFVLVLKTIGRSHKETRCWMQGSLYGSPVKRAKINKLHSSKAESLQNWIFLWTHSWVYYPVGSKTDYSSLISS